MSTGRDDDNGISGGDALGDQGEIQADLDRWDDLFDDLHGDDTHSGFTGADPEVVRLTPDEAIAELMRDDGEELEFIGEALSLGDMLAGSPAPLPEPDALGSGGELERDQGVALDAAAESFDTDVFTSARPPPTLAPAPTDEEIFAGLPAEISLDPTPIARRKGAARPDETRVADPDAALLADLAEDAAGELDSDFGGEPEATRVASPGQELLARVARDDEQGPRLAATVRREDLERMRAEGQAAPASAEARPTATTRMQPGQFLDGMTERAAAALQTHRREQDAVPGPAAEVEDFYGEIEIGAEEADPRREEAVPAPVAPTSSRRINVNIARRPPTEPPEPATAPPWLEEPSAGEAAAGAPPPDDDLFALGPAGATMSKPRPSDAIDMQVARRDFAALELELDGSEGDFDDEIPTAEGVVPESFELELEREPPSAIAQDELAGESAPAGGRRPPEAEFDHDTPTDGAGAAVAPRDELDFEAAMTASAQALEASFEHLEATAVSSSSDEIVEQSFDNAVPTAVGEADAEVMELARARSEPELEFDLIADEPLADAPAAEDPFAESSFGEDFFAHAPGDANDLFANDAFARERAADRVAAERAAAERAAAQEAVAGRAVGDEAVGDEAVGDEAVGDEAVGDEAVGDEAVGDEAVANRAAADQGAAGEPATGRAVENGAVPDRAVVQEPPVELPAADVAPALPPSLFPDAPPALELSRLELPHRSAASSDAGAAGAWEQFELCDRALERLDEPAAVSRMHLEAARLAELAGDADRAGAHYEAAADASPRSPLAARGRRRVAERLGLWDDAIAALETESSLASPAAGSALMAWRLALLVALGDRERATAAAEALLERDPTAPSALLVRAELAALDGSAEELGAAVAALAAGLGAHPLAAAARTARTAADEPATALERLALDAEPALAAAVGRLHAQLARTRGDFDGYIAGVEAAAQLAPNDAAVQRELADAYEAGGDREAAIRTYLRTATAATGSAEQADAYRCALRLLEAIDASAQDRLEALRRLSAVDPLDADTCAALELALAEVGEFEALIELDRRVADAEGGGGVYERVRIAKRLVASGLYDEAARELEAARAAGIETPVLADTLVRILGVAGRSEPRAELLASLAESEADHRDPEIAQIRAAQAAEDVAYERLAADGGSSPQAGAALDRAVEQWRGALDFDPESQVAHSALVRLAEVRGDAVAVVDALAGAQAAARHPARAMGLALRRASLLGAGSSPDPGAAEDVLREARAVDPGDPRAPAALLRLAAAAERWTDAAMVLDERAAALGETADASALRYRAAALLLDRTDETSRAVEILTRVVAARPAFEPALALLETAHRRLGDAALLTKDLERRIARGGDEADRFAQLVREAELYEHRVGDPHKAVSLYGMALEIRPADPLARDGLERACAAGDVAPLAQLALDDLRRADEADDAGAKADAYEELARIDEDLRGDRGSALISFESAARLDPGRWRVLRSLERAYATEGRREELSRVYEGQLAAAAQPADAVAISLARARILDQLDEPRRDVLREYRRAYDGERRCRPALFQLESYAAEQGPSEALAALEETIAHYFEDDPRASAAFLTRAGETRLALEDVEGAIECFRAAADAMPGYGPALDGWRRAALIGHLWLDVAAAAEHQASAAGSDAGRAALHHLAGVVLMDRAVHAERAATAFRRVLTLDPAHVDAYLRLRMLFEENGQHEDLVRLLEQRLDVEDDPRLKVELHLAAATALREYLDQPAAAREHLRRAIELDEHNGRALAALAELAWQQQQWQQAADALTGLVSVESDRAALAAALRKLGTLHAGHLPDDARAIKSFERVLELEPRDEEALDRLSVLYARAGDWKKSLAACERLLHRPERDPESKVQILHRVADALERGLGERARAERAFRAALEVDPTSSAALDAIIGFFRRTGDLRSMRVHLDMVAAAMRTRLAHVPLDPTAYRVLARALSVREETGATGSAAAGACAAELAVVLGGAEDSEQRLAARAAQVEPRIAGLGTADVDETLFHRDVPNGLRQLLHALGDRLAKATSADLKRYEVGRGDRIDRSGSAEAAIIRKLAEQLGAGDVEVYVARRDSRALAAEPGSPIKLILGAELVDPERPARLRFAAARGIKLALTHMAVLARREPMQAGALLVGLLRAFRPDFSPGGVDMGAVAAEQQRLRKVVPGGMLQELGPYAIEVAGLAFDHQRLWDAIIHSGNRAGLAAAGSVRAALEVLMLLGNHDDLASAGKDVQIVELMRFAVSEDHVALRRLLARQS